MTDEPNIDPMTAENLLEHLRAMQKYLPDKDFFPTFDESIADGLSPDDRDDAAAVLRGTLFVCTVLYDRLVGPSLLGFGAGKETMYLNLLSSIDPRKLSAHTIDALFDDVQRLIECPGDMPRTLLQVFHSREAERNAAWEEMENEERRTRKNSQKGK